MELDEHGNRIVGADTVISTLYRYHRESFCVIIKESNGNIIGRFDLNTETNTPWRIGAKSYNATDTRIDLFVRGKRGEHYEINKIPVIFEESGGHIPEDKSGQITMNKKGYYIANQPFGDYINKRFKQEFIEVDTSGIYLRPDNLGLSNDGTKLVITPGSKTVYITFTVID